MKQSKVLDIKHLAKLSNLNVDAKEEDYFLKQFEETLKIIEGFDKLDTSKSPETYQVTEIKNVFREDKIEAQPVLSQEDALSNARQTHNGYFVVKAIFNEQ